jgi:hypothetical protein
VRILEGVADLPTWDAETLQGVVGELRRLVPELQVEWGLAAGEEWCFLLLRGKLVAALRAPTANGRATRFAFILANSTVADKTRTALRQADAVTVEVDDFEAAVFSVEPDDFAGFAGFELPVGGAFREAFDPSRFSANDLIFVTT